MSKLSAQTELVGLLNQIYQADPSSDYIPLYDEPDYSVRNRLIWQAMGLAARIGYATGVRIDPSQPEWPVAYIELPTGQVSWHVPAHDRNWDGHDTVTKYQRVRQYIWNHPVVVDDV